MFRALLAHHQEALHNRHFFFVRVMSVGCATIAVKLQSWIYYDARSAKH
jgi:hypothetical protein